MAFPRFSRWSRSPIALLLTPAVVFPVGAAETLFDCRAATSFSLEKGQQPSDTQYIFSYDAAQRELVKLQEGDRPIAIHVTYRCRDDAVQIYCERHSYGTYWTTQITKSDLSFIETIGEYAGQTVGPPTNSMRGFCSKKQAVGVESEKRRQMTEDELRERYAGYTVEPNASDETKTRSAGDQLWQSIFTSQKECHTNNPSLVWQACWERSLPDKCGTLVYQARIPDATHIQRWQACALSCVDAGFWDRNFGACSRDYVAN